LPLRDTVTTKLQYRKPNVYSTAHTRQEKLNKRASEGFIIPYYCTLHYLSCLLSYPDHSYIPSFVMNHYCIHYEGLDWFGWLGIACPFLRPFSFRRNDFPLVKKHTNNMHINGD
jgi:hypothetical protein